MSKIAVIYWSGTGNTEAMANAVADGAKENGAEVLEESEFEPMFSSCEAKIHDKKIALFGSYGWGDGEWMRNWEDRCISDGAILSSESVICNDAPDDDTIENCKSLGKSLV